MKIVLTDPDLVRELYEEAARRHQSGRLSVRHAVADMLREYLRALAAARADVRVEETVRRLTV